MPRIAARQVTRVWGLLALLTLLSLAASHVGWTGHASNALILAAAFAKGRWVLMDFLKLRGVQPGWRALFLCWLGLVTVIPWATAALALLRG
ncbi:cytochrome C oxidase subunit IV family protein [Microvirga sp. CF3016]|uniref:cytochrome C oxidase subunit IV family protein n=1 Tax=Microvirga sp. CF3016 TaxID=3110181 RepID=UPI002E77B0F1|nr:cytochrome C oxidase subunit IV family protein [Microvirga sp. CF3016]MEE1609839.1 cytochrome C oxidase subunit IV family protein [Microvirga sp. CF3016]